MSALNWKKIDVTPTFHGTVVSLIRMGFDEEDAMLAAAWRKDQYPAVRAKLAQMVADGELVLVGGRYDIGENWPDGFKREIAEGGAR